MAKKKTLEFPYSGPNQKIVQLFVDKGYLEELKIKDFQSPSGKTYKLLEIKLKYINRAPALVGIKRISKPGLRIYKSAKEIQEWRTGYGILIVSTPKGIMSGEQAVKLNLGGEIICHVW